MIRELPPDTFLTAPSSDDLGKDEVVFPAAYLRIRWYVEVLLIVVFLPVILVLSLIISLLISSGSPGKVLFVQRRPGKNGQMFRMYKFRTMYNNSTEYVLAKEADSRVTLVGRWLRKYRLDEIPQLWNVLKGDMSFIGPRPVPYTFYETYLIKISGYNLRHKIRPGITGYAQVMQGYTSTLEQERLKLQYDLHYIRNISFKTDLLIIWRTLIHVAKGKS